MGVFVLNSNQNVKNVENVKSVETVRVTSLTLLTFSTSLTIYRHDKFIIIPQSI